MNITFARLSDEEAERILAWHYPADYSWTSVAEGSENRYYLKSSRLRNDRYHAIFTDGSPAGYYSLNDSIRRGYGALQLLIRPDITQRDAQKQILAAVIQDIRKTQPEVFRVNASTLYDDGDALAVYEACGFENRGRASGMGHDMQAYEQEGFEADGHSQRMTTPIILSLKL